MGLSEPTEHKQARASSILAQNATTFQFPKPNTLTKTFAAATLLSQQQITRFTNQDTLIIGCQSNFRRTMRTRKFR
jgi:hypothetical protein